MKQRAGSRRWQGVKSKKFAINLVNNDECPIISCSTLSKKTRFLIDSGSRVCIAGNKLWDQIGEYIAKSNDCKEISNIPRLVSVTGEPLKIIRAWQIPIDISSYRLMVPMLFCECQLSFDGILGNDFLQTFNIDLLAGERIRIKDEIIPLDNVREEAEEQCNNIKPIKLSKEDLNGTQRSKNRTKKQKNKKKKNRKKIKI